MKLVGGIPKSKHNGFHRKLIKENGNALKCEMETCSHVNPKRFEWALKKGHSYSSNPIDYIQMCVSCHRKYDFNEEIRAKLIAKKVGELHNKAKLKELQVLDILGMIKSGMKNKDIASIYSLDPSTISDIKRGKIWSHVKREPLSPKTEETK